MSDATPCFSIGQVAARAGLSPDTLRYYEKLGLLGPVERSPAGRRCYRPRDLSRLQFIRRAQKMGFRLAEIGQLLQMRDDPQHARPQVRQLTAAKLAEVDERLAELTTLRNELQLLLNLCRGSADGCPIIAGIEDPVE